MSSRVWIDNATNEFVVADKHREGLTRPLLERNAHGHLIHRERDPKTFKTIFRRVPKNLFRN